MEFDWDGGNQLKSLIKHGVSQEESEQVFLNPYVLRIDENHSRAEMRFELLGKTDSGKALFIIFTTRNNKIRIISARPANKNERNVYYEKQV